ncbi:HAD family acid phosphatase [Nocardioides sp. SYSU D00038]|uniref:HAD family acid phosphatase n=1 Tax=Nocardioides sp. SYSU D00038 TaxID=2812554 RepID=UPI0019686F01|nr:HAD family acid phosphatase [Nocardioides sp. SYSU D00038]
MRRVLLALLTCLAVSLPVAPGPVAALPADLPAAPRKAVPTKKQWLADVNRVMRGAGTWLDARVAEADPEARLAINLDIDNSTLMTYYAKGRPIPRVKAWTQRARRLGVTLVFNTARLPRMRPRTVRELTRAGYDIGRLCFREQGEGKVGGKTRCRASFIEQGFTIIANVGNNDTDFAGARNYGRAFRLPNYRGQLG